MVIITLTIQRHIINKIGNLTIAWGIYKETPPNHFTQNVRVGANNNIITQRHINQSQYTNETELYNILPKIKNQILNVYKNDTSK